ALKVGRFPLSLSLGSVLTKPHKYPTILASDHEIRMIPLNWVETGVQVEQACKQSTLRLAVVSGPISQFSRTYKWIGGGHQRHFAADSSDILVALASLEWGSVSQGRGVAVSYYTGNPTDNRYKMAKLQDEANVSLWSAMAN